MAGGHVIMTGGSHVIMRGGGQSCHHEGDDVGGEGLIKYFFDQLNCYALSDKGIDAYKIQNRHKGTS